MENLIDNFDEITDEVILDLDKNTDDIEGTQKIFNHRANMCSLAAKGEWTEQIENK